MTTLVHSKTVTHPHQFISQPIHTVSQFNGSKSCHKSYFNKPSPDLSKSQLHRRVTHDWFQGQSQTTKDTFFRRLLLSNTINENIKPKLHKLSVKLAMTQLLQSSSPSNITQLCKHVNYLRLNGLTLKDRSSAASPSNWYLALPNPVALLFFFFFSCCWGRSTMTSTKVFGNIPSFPLYLPLYQSSPIFSSSTTVSPALSDSSPGPSASKLCCTKAWGSTLCQWSEKKRNNQQKRKN